MTVLVSYKSNNSPVYLHKQANWLVAITFEDAQEVYELCSWYAVNAASNSY